MIALAEPTLDGNEARYLTECIDSGYVSSVGPFVDRFEREFAETTGARYAIACASGTAALHVALRLAGAESGRLVAVATFTFIASANAAAYTGADLLLVDSEPDTWNMDTELLYDEVVRRDKLGQKIPDIVEIVHALGHPAQMEPLLALRDRYGIRIVEDAAESLGASWTAGAGAGRQTGTVGELGCFSLNGNKIITAGNGGVIVTDRADLAAQAKHLTKQAKLPGSAYLHDTIGYNYRMASVNAALGCAQLERLSDKLSAKRHLAARYTAWLRDLPLDLAPRAAWAAPTYWLFSVLVHDHVRDDPERLVRLMQESGIHARRLWPPLHQQKPYVASDRLGGTTAETIYQRGMSIPSSAHLTVPDQRRVATTLAELLDDTAVVRGID